MTPKAPTGIHPILARGKLHHGGTLLPAMSTKAAEGAAAATALEQTGVAMWVLGCWAWGQAWPGSAGNSLLVEAGPGQMGLGPALTLGSSPGVPAGDV